jgi:hypothetical protein
MARHLHCVEREACCGVVSTKTKERVAEVAGIQDANVVVHHIRYIHENLNMFLERSVSRHLSKIGAEGGERLREKGTTKRTSSKPRRSHREFQEKDLRKVYRSFEASLTGWWCKMSVYVSCAVLVWTIRTPRQVFS